MAFEKKIDLVWKSHQFWLVWCNFEAVMFNYKLIAKVALPQLRYLIGLFYIMILLLLLCATWVTVCMYPALLGWRDWLFHLDFQVRCASIILLLFYVQLGQWFFLSSSAQNYIPTYEPYNNFWRCDAKKVLKSSFCTAAFKGWCTVEHRGEFVYVHLSVLLGSQLIQAPWARNQPSQFTYLNSP